MLETDVGSAAVLSTIKSFFLDVEEWLDGFRSDADAVILPIVYLMSFTRPSLAV